MSIATDLAPTPQSLFGVGSVVRDGDVSRAMMTIGDGSGPRHTAALGVLLDDILGFTLFGRRGDRDGLVSAALSATYPRPDDWEGPHLIAEGRVETFDADGGLATARIVDSAGHPVATGSVWGSFVDGVTQDRPAAVDVTPPAYAPTRPVPDLLGAVVEHTAAGVRLIVPPNPALANTIGTMHGGIITCAHELAGSIAAGDSMRTASIHVNFFRTVSLDETTVFEARVLRPGRRVSAVRVSAIDADGRECSAATVTCRRDPAGSSC